MFHLNINNTAALALIVVFTSATAFAQNDNSKPIQPRTGDPVAGKAKSLLCQGCHGEDGNSLATLVPKLAGQNAAYISKQVRNFQAGIRKHAIMNDLAATVNDDELTDIAAYFASQNKMKGDGSADNPIGKNLFLNGETSRKIVACINCHGVNGKGLEPNPSMIPVIGGQNKDYLRRQLINFRKGDRTNSPDGVMNRITKTLTDAEIESLAEYVSGQ
jgi:cytochrome c553